MFAGLVITISVISGIILVFSLGQESGYNKALRQVAKKNLHKFKDKNYGQLNQNHNHHEPEETRVHRK